MTPLNPFLRAFFRSALPAQCSPVAHHVLLVPTTEVLLNAKDRESNTSFADLASTEDFLASHVLRVPGGVPPGGGAGAGNVTNVRESKGKAKQYSTINGRTVVVKEAFVYSNKGFKTMNQAQLLQDIIYYPDVGDDGQQWLVYYISRPLVGSFQPTPVIPAVISDEPSKERKKVLAEISGSSSAAGAGKGGSSHLGQKKKDVENFGGLMTQFPMIARQMQGGLEKIVRGFVAQQGRPTGKKTAHRRRSSISSQSSNPSSIGESIKSSLSGNNTTHPTSIELEPEEETLRTALESAVTAAIELFQAVDKQQLSLLGANTELTGPVVERMIEKYVTEQVHDQTLFPRVCAARRMDDSDLDAKIRKMADVDIAQVGIPFGDGMKGKRQLAARLAKGVNTFKKMGVASSPQEMLEILLMTQKLVTETPPSTGIDDGDGEKTSAVLTINADVLVAMMLIVVIRSGVRHLHSRLLCMRYFIFIDEVERGEQGYALATLEAVLAHLTNASAGLRKASKRNRLLWQAAKDGDVQTLGTILQSEAVDVEDATLDDLPGESESSDESSPAHSPHGTSSSHDLSGEPSTDFVAVNGSLEHVFPFERPPTPPPERSQAKAKKRVSMASLPRSHSASSLHSSRSHSRHKSVDSTTSSAGGDLSVERLAQTQDGEGNSVLMMAVEAGSASALGFLLAMPAHFRAHFVLDDVNGDGATLLNAAVQSGNRAVTDEMIGYIEANAPEELHRYLAMQDSKGRCMAHYLFTQPHLIRRFGKNLPWRLKDKNGQTPLFAMFRSYDHEEYRTMVSLALQLATETQGDGAPLHLDDHVDAKGNTLLHIVNDPTIALQLLSRCDSDVNAANDKRFTPFMVGSKYGRIDLVQALFGDPRVDLTLRDIRGLTAVELAKDDDVRNRIDDLVLLSNPPDPDGRITRVVRSFFVEDATTRFVLKSAAPNANGGFTLTTCHRSLADFENLARLLRIECPASWLPNHFDLPSPFLIPSKPSRAVLRDVQMRLDHFFHTLLTHNTFATHELVWEFFLVPEMDVAMLTERSKRKATAREENVKDDYEPVTDTQEVEDFVQSVRDQMRGVLDATRTTMRTVNRHRMIANDLAEAHHLAACRLSTCLFLPDPHLAAFRRHSRTLVPSDAAPLVALYHAVRAIDSSGSAIHGALDRPRHLVATMHNNRRVLDRNLAMLARPRRWTPRLGGLFEDASRTATVDARGRVERARVDLDTLGCELRHAQQTVASELAGWQDEHARQGRRMLRKLARETVVRERTRLEDMQRALREVRR